jgi:hypothetical protein
MDADSHGCQENEHAAPSAERRSGIERRMSSGRRRAESAGATLDAPAGSPLKEPKSVRKYHFRSFEDRRGGIERRVPSGDHESGACRSLPDADDERLTADDVASRLRQEG